MPVAQRKRNIARHVRENTAIWSEAISLFEKGEFAQAEETFSSMDYVTSAVQFNAATCSLSMGDVEKAIEIYTETLKRDKHFVLAYCQRAMSFHIYGWNEDALRDLHEAHRRMRGNRFIDYTNLGLSYVQWECQILANIAVIYVCLGLQRHALHYLEQAHKSREDSFNERPGNDTQELLEIALPNDVVSDLVGYCDATENHKEKTCAFLQLDPQPIFRPRGLSSLWLHASQKIKKNFMGKAKVLYCLGSQKEAGFEGAQAKAAGKPLPVKSEWERAAGGPLALALSKTLKKHRRGGGEPRNHRANSDVGPGTDTSSSKANTGTRTERSQSSPATPNTAEGAKESSLKAKARNATLKSRRASILSSVSERSNESTLQSQRGGVKAASATATSAASQSTLQASKPGSNEEEQASSDTADPIYDDIDDDGADVVVCAGVEAEEQVTVDEDEEEQENEEEEAASGSETELGELSQTEEAALTALQLLTEQLVSKQRNTLGNQAAITALLKSITDITTHLQNQSPSSPRKSAPQTKPSKSSSSKKSSGGGKDRTRGRSGSMSDTSSSATAALSKLSIGERTTESFPLPSESDTDFGEDTDVYQFHATLLRGQSAARSEQENVYENHQPSGSESTPQRMTRAPSNNPDSLVITQSNGNSESEDSCIYMNCISASNTGNSSPATSSRSSSSTLLTIVPATTAATTAAEDSASLYQLTKSSFIKQRDVNDRSGILVSPVSPQENIAVRNASSGYFSAPEGKGARSTSRGKRETAQLVTESCDERSTRRRLSSAFDGLEGDLGGLKARLKEKKAAHIATKKSGPVRALSQGNMPSAASGAQLTAAQRVATLQRSGAGAEEISHYVNIRPTGSLNQQQDEADDNTYERIVPSVSDLSSAAQSGSESQDSMSATKAKKKMPPKRPNRPTSIDSPHAKSPSPPESDAEKPKRPAPAVAPKAKGIIRNSQLQQQQQQQPQQATTARSPMLPRNPPKVASPTAARPNEALVSACFGGESASSSRRMSSASSVGPPSSGRKRLGSRSQLQESMDDSDYASRARSISVTSICSAFETPSDSFIRSQRPRADSSSFESDFSSTRTRVTSHSSAAYDTDSSAIPGNYRRQRLVSFSESPLQAGTSHAQHNGHSSDHRRAERRHMSDMDTDTDVPFDDEKYGLPPSKVAAITRWRESQPKSGACKPKKVTVSSAARSDRTPSQQSRPRPAAARRKSSDRVPPVVNCNS
ncbi:AF4/FMR2 family member lilli-like isoform X1 [Sycon ciliatum]|uniref:AF4/FMR2 family member lilli-like isoform X1 n=2 Tax=Sycon ciliatum TaxID=27933 RepID=UPI0031F6B419